MNPIISPWWFYLIHIINGISSGFILMAAVGTISTGVLLIFVVCNIWDPLQTEGQKVWMKKVPKWVTTSIIVTLIGLFLATVIPDKQTCYTMMVANAITPNNLTAVKESGQDIVDYIIEASEKLSKKGKDK